MKKMLLAAVALGVCGAVPANAVTYLFTYTGTSAMTGAFTASLTLDVPTAGSAATSISGTRNGVAVTGLSSYASADNLFSPTAPFVSYSGISYSTAGGPDFNVFFDGGSTLYELNSASNPGGFFDGDAPLRTVSATVIPAGAVPEPATWGLMLVGFGAMGALMRSRRNVAVSFR